MVSTLPMVGATPATTSSATPDATPDAAPDATPGAPARGGAGSERSLVGLLGDTRAQLVRLLKRHGERSAPELAEDLGISDVAVRKHLAALDRDGLVTERTVNRGRGRPVARYRLTDRGEELFAHRYPELVDELLAYLAEQHGQAELRAFLRWRQEREAAAYAAAVDADGLPERLAQLAAALTEAGFEAEVTETDDGFCLTQSHCVVYEVARDHPEMCAHEAAMFRRVLGPVRISRRETLANGANACVCSVTPTRA